VISRKPQRNTRQRRVVLEEIRKLRSHPTAVELYEIARVRVPKISLGTVYRNLEFLAQNGLIQKLEIGREEARFDGNPDRHYHVRCVGCGQVDDVRDLAADPVSGKVRSVHGYEILSFRLEFTGVCPDCSKRSRAEAGEGPFAGKVPARPREAE